ncbi:insulin-like growth factor-binding protein 2 [Eublepharis macularius]|uniref:Insulin-like growth factor-binding protein 2 n=1 Tax=Eublepharis macularius TaxID=481883 RepID=A0AA97J014_EUBMA|nr:insulin-like growth factor-binding protein 2 [Eublepharis macularius]
MVQLQRFIAGGYLWLALGLWAPAGLALPEVLFRCPPCTAERLAACSPLPPASVGPGSVACPELVREPGCGCCPVCARLEAEPCGVYTPRCASGLRCYPRPGAELPLQALMQGQGTCARRRDAPEYGTASVEHRGTDDEHPEVSLAENHVDNTASVVTGSGVRKVKNDKELAVVRERANEQQKQMGKPAKHHPHLELRPTSLRTSCQQELDQVLERISTMRLPDERGPLEHLYSLNIPNCDKQGLYNLKQCKMSVNGQRGECWCVNPNTGKTIQGAPTIRGDPECHLFYTGHEQEDRGAHVN